MKARHIRVLTAGVTVVLALVVIGFILENWLDDVMYQRRQAAMVERVLESDPIILRDVCRGLLARHLGVDKDLALSHPDVPETVRHLNPVRIQIASDRIAIELGDEFNPFGVIVFSENRTNDQPYANGQYGVLKWIDDLWLYHDGQLDDWDPPVIDTL